MLPEAEFVFLDELFNANSAILNNLLTVLNERVYRRGIETHTLPLLSLFSASTNRKLWRARCPFDKRVLSSNGRNCTEKNCSGTGNFYSAAPVLTQFNR